MRSAKSTKNCYWRKQKLFCASRRARVLKKSGPASWPSKCHFGTIWVYHREHNHLTQRCKRTFSPISQQAESTPIRYRRKRKLFCASRRARVLKKSGLASWPAKCHFGTIWVYRREHISLSQNCKRTFSNHFSASRTHPDLLPVKRETFLRVAPRTRVEKIRSGQLAIQVPFWHYLGISPGTHLLKPELQAHVFRHFSASDTQKNSLFTGSESGWIRLAEKWGETCACNSGSSWCVPGGIPK